MWGASDQPPGAMEEGPPESVVQDKEACEQNKNQLESLKEIMMRNKQTLKKKEEEVQEYARRLSKIKSRAKLSRRNKEGSHSKDVTALVKPDTSVTQNVEDTVDDINQAKSSKAKSSLLQRKLEENRRVFEQRSKEMTETKRAVEEKVVAIRQQLDERSAAMELQRESLPVMPVRPVTITSELGHIPDADSRVAELNSKILELEAIIIDLRENLKEKDSVIESKTKAVTLMSADLSKKGKTTLDTLEDTKDEMRTMQEHFVLMETSLKNKNTNLLEQLHDRDSRILELENSIKGLEHQVEERKLAESTSAHMTRSTMDTLADTKDAMKSMQENFVLIESSLKLKNDNLLQQLQDYEVKLADANERIFNFESGVGIIKSVEVEDLLVKIEKYEQKNRQLQDEKYELQKSIAEMQDKIIASKSANGNGVVLEKDNRIAELENLIDELKQSNQLLEEESKTELQKQLADLSVKNDEYSNKIIDLEKMVHNLELQRNELASRLSDETSAQENGKVTQLTKELDELNKSMIKIKAQHRSKMKNLQKQLDSFKMVSDANAELVRMGNQVALLEEEKAAAGDWQERIIDLESKVSVQTKEIQMHIDAIAILENQKLDLMQELHSVKQEISALEAENAESENLRVTAEMKVVDLEEQLESLHKSQGDNKNNSITVLNEDELLQKIESLTQQNSELFSKLSKLEEKGTSDAGSTESFETIQDADKSELLRKIEELVLKNNELTLKLSKLEEKDGSQAGSTESFEAIPDTDRNELLKKIDQLTQENSDLLIKLSRGEEKGSSDTGSTESFERIPEHSESITKIELLTQENNDLVIKLTKLEEKLGYTEGNIEAAMSESKPVSGDVSYETLVQDNSNLSIELTKLQARVAELTDENSSLQKRIEELLEENSAIMTRTATLEEQLAQFDKEKLDTDHRLKRSVDSEDELNILIREKERLLQDVISLQDLIKQQTENISQHEQENTDMQSKLDALVNENAETVIKLTKLEEVNTRLNESLGKMTHYRDELQAKIDELQADECATERRVLIDKLEKLNQEKESVAQEKQELRKEIDTLLYKSNEELSGTRKVDDVSIEQQRPDAVIALENEIATCKKLIAEQSGAIEEMRHNLMGKEEQLEKMAKQIADHEAIEMKDEALSRELKDMNSTLEEWMFKCNDMEERMNALATAKASIEADLNALQNQNRILIEQSEKSEIATSTLKEQYDGVVNDLEGRLEQEITIVSAKEHEILQLKEELNDKNLELHKKYAQLQNEMIAIDTLQDDLNVCKLALQEKNETVRLLSETVQGLREIVRTNEEEIYATKKANDELYNKLQRSRPIEEYDDLLENLRSQQISVQNMEDKVDEYVTENAALLTRIEKLSADKEAIQRELTQKEQEVSGLAVTVEQLNAQITDSETAKMEVEKRASDLQAVLDKNAEHVGNLQSELKNSYLLLEQLKIKHTEDMGMEHERLESVMDDLNAKIRENEELKAELDEKNALIGQNFTEEMKNSLEAQVASLQQKLTESEAKIQVQLEKMKKIAATLKKKTAMCQELEARVVELEQKWTTEKDEKEANNKKIQEVESSMREKDNEIVELEEKLQQMRNETMEALAKAYELEVELRTSREKITVLVEQVTEMNDEIEKLRANADNLNAELATEKKNKEKLVTQYEQRLLQEAQAKETVLDEVKENARELSVRMEVTEKRYVEQLTQIQNLEAENGLLLSKHAQINEKLENAEKESEERRALIEKLQKEIASTASTATQTPAEDSGDDDTRGGVQRCEHCQQCQTVVMALEAKLQERQAEIENLDNELANSIGNMYHMQSQTAGFDDMMNKTGAVSNNLVELYNNLLFQYNSLMASNEEIKAKLDNTLRENRELIEKIESLQALNATLEERILSVEQELMQDKGATEKLQNLNVLYANLVKECERQVADLRVAQQEVEAARNHSDLCGQELESRTRQFNTEKHNLTQKYESLCEQKGSLLEEIEHLKFAKQSILEKVRLLETELEEQKRKNIEANESDKSKQSDRASVTQGDTLEELDNTPKLFDASKIFGMPSVTISDNQKETIRLQNLLSEKDAQYNDLLKDFDQLQKQISQERSQMVHNYDQSANDSLTAQEGCREIQIELEKAQTALVERNRQMDALHIELSNIQTQIETQLEQQKECEEKCITIAFIKNKEIEELSLELNSVKETLESLTMVCADQDQSLEAYKLQIANLKTELRGGREGGSVGELENRISIALKEKDFLMLQITDLTRALEEAKESSEKVHKLEKEIANITHERDTAREEILKLSQALNIQLTTKKEKLDVDSIINVTEEQMFASTVHPVEISKPVKESVQQSVHLEVGATYDSGSNDKLNVDEDTWGWNAEDAQLAEDQHVTTSSLVPTKEMQLQAKVDDLQDQIRELEAEKEKILEENKVAQIRSGKLVKRLKEYKAQTENLQQQLKIQKSANDFCELDSAIEEELKSQIKSSEQSLSKLKEDHKNILAEKDALLQRLDVLMSANERYLEMKERQDMDVEVLRIQNKELSNKLQTLEWQLHEQGGTSDNAEPSTVTDETVRHVQEFDNMLEYSSRQKREVAEPLSEFDMRVNHKAEIDDLKDELEALAAENEQLQHYLEEQKTNISDLESQLASTMKDSATLEEAMFKNTKLQDDLDKTRQEYDVLRKQYEQNLLDTNDQVAIMRQNNDLLKAELERSAMEERAMTLTNTEDKLTTVNVSLTEVTDLLNARVQEVAELKQQLQRQYMDRDEAEARLQKTIHALNQELHERKQELDHLREAFSAKENELTQQKSIDTVSAVISQATQELSQKHAIEIEEKDKMLQKLSEKILMMQNTIDEDAATLQRITHDMDDQRQEASGAKQELLEKDIALDNAMSRLATTDEKLAKAHSMLIEREEEFKRSMLQAEERLVKLEEQVKNYEVQFQRNKQEIDELQAELQRIQMLEAKLSEKSEAINSLNVQIEQMKRTLSDKECSIDVLTKRLNDKQYELDKLLNSAQQPTSQPSTGPSFIDDLPVFRMGNDDDVNVQATTDELKAAMEVKQQEIERLKYILSENTYPRMIQEMQDRIDCLYEEKSRLEASLQTATQTLAEKEKEAESLKQTLDIQRQEFVAKEETNIVGRDPGLTTDQEEILRLQNEINTKEQQINELMYVMAQKDSQLSLQASMEPQTDEFELQETIQRLTGKLYGKEQEIQHLKLTINEQLNEIARLREMERLSEERKIAIESLTLEKEGIRVEAEELLEKKLKEKEMEIDEIKQRLLEENDRFHENQFREKIAESVQVLHQMEEELLRVTAELAEKNRRLEELSITTFDELRDLKDQIHEKDVRIKELLMLSEDEERQLSELRLTLEIRETEIYSLKEQLDEKVREFELIERALKKDDPVLDIQPSSSLGSASTSEAQDIISNDLDRALYMLHQRDVRCEELTHELMQLLEERDTLQLRLSNAIRINEELRRAISAEVSPTKNLSPSSGSDELLIEQPSPSKSEGPVEIAKEAIHDPVGENKEILAEKLSQLHKVGHAKDVRLKDDSEMRHAQQMSLLMHKDVLTRDVQSQSSVLLNWLWGKSTPKVVHM